tara:strand:+ start:408 stop:653 length:246 start_codon:yes stop_codon:yes gene_type:complete
METIYLNDFLDGEILREKVFREKVAKMDWSQYQDKRVLIKGCSEVPIPTWAYLILTAELAQFVKRIYFGELRSAIKIFVKE